MLTTLQAQKRDTKAQKAHLLLQERKIPAVMYGHGFASESLTLGQRDFEQLYRTAGESTLIDVAVEGATSVKALIHAVDYDPVSSAVRHVDLYRVTMTEKITAEIPLVFVGEAPAVKELGGILVKNLGKIKVSCLPADLVTSIEVSCASLKTFDDYVYVRDLAIPAAITVLDNPNDIVVTVTPPRVEEVVAAVPTEEKDKVAEVEVVGKKEKKSGEEGEAEAAAEKGEKGEKKSGEAGPPAGPDRASRGGSAGEKKKKK